MDSFDQLFSVPGRAMIPVRRVIDKMNEYMSRLDYAGAERHLNYWLAEARAGGDRRGELTVLNELIGHCRKTGQKEAAERYSGEALSLLDALELGGSVTAGTTYINIATAAYVFGDYVRSMDMFDRAESVYLRNPDTDPQLLGGLYKSWDAAEYDALLERLQIPRDKPYGEFSRGNKMKLGIAIALAHHPRLLLLDEPTSGLDPVVRDEVVELFSEFTRDEGHSILISSHIVSDLERLCDYVAFLHDGRLLLCEEKDALLDQFALYRCSPEELAAIDPAAVIGKKETSYGVSALVRRAALPAGADFSPVTLEELFVAMVKEGQA